MPIFLATNIAEEYDMAETIKFVHGDTAPQLKITITDSVSGNVVNLTGYVVTVYIRAVGSANLILTKVPIITSPATLGECVITWNTNDLIQAAGSYEAEIELYNASLGIRETIFDLLSLSIRAEVGPVAAG